MRRSCWKATWVGHTWRRGVLVVLAVREHHSSGMGLMTWVDRSSTRDDVTDAATDASLLGVVRMCGMVVLHS